MNNLHITNSYKVWDTYTMSVMIWDEFEKQNVNFGSPSDYDRMKASYDEQKAQLQMATGYGLPEVGSDGES